MGTPQRSRFGIVAAATAVVLTACSSAGPTPPWPIASEPRSASVTALTPTAPASAAGPQCGEIAATTEQPAYVFPTISLPADTACQVVGTLLDPDLVEVTNDGPVVALTDTLSIWLGDLREAGTAVVYRPPVDWTVNSIEMVGGRLVWLESATESTAWAIRRLDVSSGSIGLIASEGDADFAGIPIDLHFDGTRVAVYAESGLPYSPDGSNARTYLEILGIDGSVQAVIPFATFVDGYALVNDGLVYTTGAGENPMVGPPSPFELWHWTPQTGSVKVGDGAFMLCAEGDRVAWIDGTWSRVEVTYSPFTSSTVLVRAPIVWGIACGSGTAGWWEDDSSGQAAPALTVYQPGWSAPRQLNLRGNWGDHHSLGGGWVVWSEARARTDLSVAPDRLIRGLPISELG